MTNQPKSVPANQPASGTTSDPAPLNTQAGVDPAVAVNAGHVRFNLSDLYSGIHDPQIDLDLQALEGHMKDFDANCRGKLDTKLGDAIDGLKTISALSSKIGVYIMLMRSCDETNEEIKSIAAGINERLSRASGDHTTFFDIELGKLGDTVYNTLLASDPRVAFHKPWLDTIREDAKYSLTEEVERALTIRGPVGPGQWTKFINRQLASARFPLDTDGALKELSLEPILNILAESPSRQERAAALHSLNKVLGEKIAPIAVEALNNIIGLKNIEDRERGRPHPMAARNFSNKVSDEVVNALHDAVKTKGSELAKRFYKLVAHHIGTQTLDWSDRNAPLAQNSTIIPWNEAINIVTDAYRSFSPTLERIFREMIDSGRVDAPHYESKRGGAFNVSAVFPDGSARSYNLLNYQGSLRDVQTLAHEGGHGGHGVLAGEAQGPLMQQAPIAYAETASIFAEMVTFNYLLDRVGSPAERLSLLMDKTKDFMNSVVRQISFSSFEQKIHEARKKGEITTQQFNAAWIESTGEFYGPEGEVFNYKNMENMWTYITHFHRPFYVYGYAFGELLTQSLYAVRNDFGDKFEPLYLDLLRAGGSKDAVELLAPFGLDPRNPRFWTKGMEESVEKWIDEAERLTYQGGISVVE